MQVWIRSIIISFMLFVVSVSFAEPKQQIKNNNPPNLSTIKKQLIRYHDSGKYDEQLCHALQLGISYLQFRINQEKYIHHSKKMAIVLDIDETSLSNYSNLRRLNFGGTKQQTNANVNRANDPAISYTKNLYKYAKAHHVAVFFVTGRRENERAATIKNLKKAGYNGWNRLYLKPNNYHKSSVVPYKTDCRKAITKAGYDIILNVGDQMSDLKGGYADMAIKLPNPFYYIN